jgi:Sec-independent protein translocase protein TatA
MGGGSIILIILVILLLFGAKRIPELARGLEEESENSKMPPKKFRMILKKV